MSDAPTKTSGLLPLPGLEAAGLPGLVHGCTTRALGCVTTPDTLERIATLTGFPVSTIARGRQLHKTHVLTIEVGSNGQPTGPHDLGADAMITRERGLALLTTAADCLPLALVDPVSRSLGVAHAGWRGAVAGIAATTVGALATRFAAEPAELIAVIGPHIHPCCFEVGPEVVEAARSCPGGSACVVPPPAGSESSRNHLDLGALVRADLLDAGVLPGNVHTLPHCTVCDARFFSYRGDRTSSRHGVLLGWAG
ncbi:MAG: polyphenol oxidase family protein [Planctomycetota bacterium]